MQIEHKTEKGTLCFVKVPDDASDLTLPKVGMIDLYFKTKVQSEYEEDNYISIGLPNIGFQLIGLTSEITDSYAMNMLDYQSDNDEHQSPIWRDYINGQYHLSPVDSFKSLMQHLQVYEVNPYEYPIYHDYSSDIKWKEANAKWKYSESRTGKWIVLFKPND